MDPKKHREGLMKPRDWVILGHEMAGGAHDGHAGAANSTRIITIPGLGWGQVDTAARYRKLTVR